MKQIIFLSICFSFLSCNNEEVLANERLNIPIKSRVIGGKDADMRLYSYTLILRVRGKFFCTAFPITDEDLLSAAHCFTHVEEVQYPYSDVTVHSRTSSLLDIGTVHEIEQVTVHPGFTGNWDGSLVHDIAHILLTEKTKLELDENQRKLDLPRNDVVSNTLGILTGWGYIDMTYMIPTDRLQMLQMWILNQTDCQPQMHRVLHKQQLCAFHSVGHGCANGDSGAPLVINNEAVGLHSWCRHNKCGAGLAEVFVNVFQEKDFIQSTMRTKRRGKNPSSSQQRKGKGKQIMGESSQSEDYERQIERGEISHLESNEEQIKEESSDSEDKGKQHQEEPSKRKKRGWLRKMLCKKKLT